MKTTVVSQPTVTSSDGRCKVRRHFRYDGCSVCFSQTPTQYPHPSVAYFYFSILVHRRAVGLSDLHPYLPNSSVRATGPALRAKLTPKKFARKSSGFTVFIAIPRLCYSLLSSPAVNAGREDSLSRTFPYRTERMQCLLVGIGNPCCELVSSEFYYSGRRGKSIRSASKCSRARIIHSGRPVHLIWFERYSDFSLAYYSCPFYSPELWRCIVPQENM